MPATPVNIVLFSLSQSAIALYLCPTLFRAETLTSFFLIFSLVNWSIFGFYWLIVYPFFLSPLRHLPTPSRGFIPLFGHGLRIFQKPAGDAHLQMMKQTPNEGLIYLRSFLHTDRLLVAGPAALADVLVHKSYDFERPTWVRDFLIKFLGDGLLMTEGDEHKHQRKHIMPAFSFRHIKELYPVFWSKSLELCEVIKKELSASSDSVLDIEHPARQATLDVIGLAGLGRDIGSLRNGDDELSKIYEEILEPTAEKGLYFIVNLVLPAWLIRLLPWGLHERVRITTTKLRSIFRDFVVEKRGKMKQESQESVDTLSIMIRSNNFSDDDLVDQLLTFIAAGHETTSSTLTWTTHLLATNPSTQAKLRAEIHAAIPSPEAFTTTTPPSDLASLLESLPYLNAVCNETLRLFPTIPMTSRITVRDTSICGHYVPNKTVVFIVPWATNRDPAFWGADADVFRPERWIDSETGRATMKGGAESNYSFLTFLHGPRSCIGERFARAELRALVAALVGSFDVEMADPNEVVKVGGSLTSKPVNGMRVRLTPVAWGKSGAGKGPTG